jgi:hypothetical protein
VVGEEDNREAAKSAKKKAPRAFHPAENRVSLAAVLLPLLLLVPAAVAIALVAYGVHPAWAQFPHGLELIMLSRRLQWPLMALAIVLCIALIAMIISGRYRAWWLVGLAPILALLAHRFALDPDNAFAVNPRPDFVMADQAAFVGPDDWIVGLVDDQGATAYPYASLYRSPVIVQSDQEKPLILLWSPFANSAFAAQVDRSIRAEELEILSMPANALLVYNARLGQFINGVTGRTPKGEIPAGFKSVELTVKTTWRRWLALHPDTRVLIPMAPNLQAPARPILPGFPMPPGASPVAPDTQVALLRQGTVAAIKDSLITTAPLNFSDPLVVVRRGESTQSVEAFSRQIDSDLFPEFAPRHFSKFPQATMMDTDSLAPWTNDFRALDGTLKDKRLTPVVVDDGVYYSVARFWFPGLTLAQPLPAPAIAEEKPAPPVARVRHRRHRAKTAS